MTDKRLGDVVEGMGKLEAGVGKLANLPGAPEAGNGAAGIDPKEHGHLTLAALFQQLRDDEAAAKRDDAHWYGKEAFQQILGGKPEAQPAGKAKEQDQGIERGDS